MTTAAVHRPNPFILIVEDDPATQELYNDALTHGGYRVACVDDGAQALADITAHKPDLIVTDIGLRTFNGDVLVGLLKSVPETRDIPVIAVTGRPLTDEAEFSRKTAVAALLKKPVSPERLRQEIARVLADCEGARQNAEGARGRARTALKRSETVIQRSISTRPPRDPRRVRCPGCGHSLTFRETNTLGGVRHDYFVPCAHGCGEFYYNQYRRQMHKLRD